jgi:RNA polymerase sigma-70 factor (ECF subfamily)
VLKDLEGMDYGRIAESLEIPRGTVKSRLHRARCALRTILERDHA